MVQLFSWRGLLWDLKTIKALESSVTEIADSKSDIVMGKLQCECISLHAYSYLCVHMQMCAFGSA